MKRYAVYFSNKVESFEMETFETLTEAQAFCNEQTAEEEVAEVILDNETHGAHRYEVYDLDNFNEENGLGEAVFATSFYWDK